MKKRVLFIDNDEEITGIIQELIKLIGYESDISRDSYTAIKLLKSQPEGFDLVITDMNMPHMSGLELSRRLLNIRPDLPIIVCIGDDQSSLKESAIDVGVKGFLSKPFSMGELKAAVNQMLT